jgi:hypothetical protein
MWILNLPNNRYLPLCIFYGIFFLICQFTRLNTHLESYTKWMVAFENSLMNANFLIVKCIVYSTLTAALDITIYIHYIAVLA